MSPKHKPLVWLSGEVKSPPFSAEARVEAVDAVVIADVFAKTTQGTPATVIKNSQRRLRAYDDAAKG